MNSTDHFSSAPNPDALHSSFLRGWLAVSSLVLGAFASVTAEFLPVGVLPDVAEAFSVSAGQAGLMMTLPGILAAIAAPGVMLLSGRADRRRVLLLLSVILLGACLASAWAPAFWLLLLSRALVGISLGAFWSMALAVAIRLVPPGKAHKAAAAVFAGVTGAMILGVPLGTLVAEHFSWRGSFIAAAAITAVALIAQVWALPPIPAESALRMSALVRFVQRAASRKSMAMITLVFVAHFGSYTYVAPLLRQAGISPPSITVILLAYGVAGFLSNYVASHFVGSQLRASLLVVKLLLLLSLALLPILTAMPAGQIVLVLVWGIAWGALPLCLNTWNRSVSGSDTEASAAMFTFTGQTAIALGSGLGGVIVDHAGLTTTYWAGAATVLLSILLLTANEPRGAASPSFTPPP